MNNFYIRKKFKNTNGITLIALVVTIIILLILAGVSIAMLTGNNGILSQAGKAKEETKRSSEDEQKKLNDLSDWIETSVGKIEYNEELKALKSGDYIIYDTGVEGVGEVTCRVLYDAESPYNLQIITDDCIKKNGEYVYIPFGDMEYLKECTWNSNEKFSNYDFSEWYKYEGNEVEEYNNVINILNAKAMEFTNDKYIVDARCVGSNPINKEKETKRFTEMPEEVISEQEEKGYPVSKDNTGAKDEDDNYETDYNTLRNLNILNVNKHYWFASRYNEVGPVYSTNKGLIFYLRNDGGYEYTYKNGEILKSDHDGTYGIYWGGAQAHACSGESENLSINAFRPVFTLKGNLKVVSGDGTSENTAYRLGV